MITLCLLGGASLETDGARLTGPATQRHRLALLAMLAASHPRGVARDKLIGYLWPERDAEHGRNLLNQSVHVLRKVLGQTALVSAGDELRLDAGALDCDVVAFEAALAAGDHERAVGLYAGPFLDGFFLSEAPEFERWVDEERDRLRRVYRRALEQWAVDRRESGDLAGAMECWQRLVADDPYNASATLRLMEALEAAGDRAGAIRQARQHEILMEQEFDAGPDPQVMALAERLRTASAPDSKALNGPVAPPAATDAELSPMRAPDRQAGVDRTTSEVVLGAGWVEGSRRRMAAVLILLLAFGVVGFAGLVAARKQGRPLKEIRRIAVLPLANLTGDSQQNHLVAALHDALILELSQIDALTVLSRQSVLGYLRSDERLPKIGRELGVDALIEGAVYQSGDSVRITVRLVRAEPEQQLWAAAHHVPLSHALTRQGELARSITAALRVPVAQNVRARLARRRTVSPDVWQAYVNGLYHLEHASFGPGIPRLDRVEAIQIAIRNLEEAVALDPSWATAHAKLALAYHWLASNALTVDADEFFPKAKNTALQALALDDTESQAWASLGFVLFRYEWDWVGAERAIRRALELDANTHHWIYALYLSAAGRRDEAIRHYRLAQERNPLSDHLKHQLAGTFACADRREEALETARDMLARVGPTGRTGVVGDTVWFLNFVAHQYSLMGLHDEAVAAAEQLVARSETVESGTTLAFVYARSGRVEEALALAEQLEARARSNGLPWRATSRADLRSHLYAVLGETERAIDMLEAFYGTRRAWLSVIRCDLGYKLLRHEPRVQALVRPVAFPN